MGSFFTKPMSNVMDENMKKQQEFQLSAQKMQMERQMMMQVQMRNKGVAQQLSMAREAFNWIEIQPQYFSCLPNDADKILSNETGLLRLPGEPLSVAMIDRERSKS
uniref:Uncharacterized protein n=1 Tax=Amphimedon queenslandica TaxID=400682 RepID=A0A1X7TSB4_AMPQE